MGEGVEAPYRRSTAFCAGVNGDLELPVEVPILAPCAPYRLAPALLAASTSSCWISLQELELVPLSTSLALLMLPSLECLLGDRTGACRLSVLILGPSAMRGTMAARDAVGTVCMTKNLSVALASPSV